jgi:hypothetical protein
MVGKMKIRIVYLDKRDQIYGVLNNFPSIK